MRTPTSSLVLVDSSLWIDFLWYSTSPGRSELAELMKRRLAATTGVVSTEVLRGARSPEHFARLARLLNRVHYLDATQAVWETVAELAFALMSRGKALPLPGLVIGAVALQHGCPLYTLDQDFPANTGPQAVRARALDGASGDGGHPQGHLLRQGRHAEGLRGWNEGLAGRGHRATDKARPRR